MDFRLACTRAQEKMPNVACNISSFFFLSDCEDNTRISQTKPAKTEHECDSEEYFWTMKLLKNKKKKKRVKKFHKNARHLGHLNNVDVSALELWNTTTKIITTLCILAEQCKTTTNHNKKTLALFSHEGFVFTMISCETRCVGVKQESDA